MRPASEIHSALDLVTAECDRIADLSAEKINHDAVRNLDLVRHVLGWVAGEEIDAADPDHPHPWLVAFLLDDPPQITDAPPGAN